MPVTGSARYSALKDVIAQKHSSTVPFTSEQFWGKSGARKLVDRWGGRKPIIVAIIKRAGESGATYHDAATLLDEEFKALQEKYQTGDVVVLHFHLSILNQLLVNTATGSRAVTTD